MSGKNKILFKGVYIVFLLLVSTIVFAKEDFIATSQKQTLLSCGCSTTSDIITIKNTDILTSKYTISLKGSAAKWATVAPAFFSLGPGETANVYTYITPPCNVKGDYDLSIYIITSYGFTKVLHQKVSVKNCQNIYLVSTTLSQKACQCTPVTFEVKIGNVGGYIETYELSVDKSIEKYVVFSENPVVILPGGSKNVFVSAIMPCDIIKQQDILLTAKAKKSGFISKIPLKLDITPCYNFDLVSGDYINSIFVPSADTPYEICENTQKSIPVKIINKDVANAYDLKLIGPEWATLSANRISIIGKEGIFKINVAPVTSGLFNITADVTAQKGMVNKKESIYIKSEICYTPKITVKRKININYSSRITEIEIKNTGSKKADYVFGLEGSNWITLEPRTLALNPGETKKILLRTAPNAQVTEGTYNILIKTTVVKTGQTYSKELKVQLREKYFLDKYLQEKYLKLSPFIIIFLAFLIFIIIYLAKLPPKEKPKPTVEIKKIEKKEIKKPEKVKPKKEKPKAKIKISPKLLKKYIITAVVIITLITIILVSSFTDVIPKFINATKINLTEIAVPPEVTPPAEKPEIKPLNLTGIIGPVKGWLSFYKYYFFAGIILLIIIVIVLSQTTKKPKKRVEEKIEKPEKKVKIKVKKIEKKAEKVENIIPEEKPPKNLKWLWWIIALIILAGIGYILYRYYSKLKELAARLLQSPFFATIKETTATYMYYILAGIIILIMFVIILSRRKKVEAAKEERPSYLSYIFGLIVLAVIVAAIYYLVKFVIIPYWVYIVIGIAFLILVLILLAILKKIKAKTSEEKSWAEVSPDSDIKLEMDNRRIAFGELSLRTKTKLNNVRIGFKKLPKKPTFLSAAEKVYEYFEIDKENIKNANIKKGLIRFRVKKSWLDDNQTEPEQIILKNYNNKWISANTKVVDSNDDYVYYEAEVKRLGYFAVVAKPTRKAEQEEKSVPKWPFVILFVLLIVAGAYLYYYYTAPAEEITTQREPILQKEFVTQVWDEDTSLTIDLSKYFIDPDNDKLKFTSTKPEHIDVIISGSIVTLTPKSNWYGTEYIVFTADDSKGGIVSTPKVTLTVQDIPEQMIFKKIQGWFSNTWKSAKGHFSGYLSYVIYGLIALVILILVIKYNRAIVDFFLEDEEKKKREKKKN